MKTTLNGRPPLASSTSVPKKSPDMTRETRSAEDTLALAREVGRHLAPGDWLALMGELGTGKTVFVRGVAEGLNLNEVPTSPTFAIVQVHRPRKGGGAALRHVDLYRLSAAEVPALEWEELHDDDGVTVVEWAEKARPLWPEGCLAVRLSHQGGDARRVEFFACGARSGEIVKRLKGKK